MRGKSVKEEYGGEGGLREVILREIREMGDGFWGLLDLQRGVEFWSGIVSVQAPGLLEVLGTGARISI
jgi:hypothetical protein